MHGILIDMQMSTPLEGILLMLQDIVILETPFLPDCLCIGGGIESEGIDEVLGGVRYDSAKWEYFAETGMPIAFVDPQLLPRIFPFVAMAGINDTIDLCSFVEVEKNFVPKTNSDRLLAAYCASVSLLLETLRAYPMEARRT